MQILQRLLILLVLPFVLFVATFASVTSIHAPAVITNESRGTLTIITLNLTSGDGAVTISGPISVGTSTLDSAREAALVASAYAGVNSSNYNFSYTISDRNTSVSGPSAGLAFTLLAVSALEHKPLLGNFTVSGEILSNGSVGLIGGVYDKAEAASNGKMRFFILPNSSQGGSLESLIYYISQSVFKVPIVQIDNMSQALQYATGLAAPEPFFYNVTQHYALSGVPQVNLTCSACNESLFDGLANFTLNFTGSAVAGIGANFSSAKQQMLANDQRFAELNAKGYAYTAADFAFLQYLSAFVLDNAGNYTAYGASSVLSNISNFCSSLQQPILNSANYEYAIGGELRQELANITLAQASSLLNSSQVTSDSYIESLYYGAEALGWCKAAQYMYNISDQLSGNYVAISGSLRSAAASAISNAARFGSNIYLDSATKSFSAGNYPVALYAATYAAVLGNQRLTSGMTSAQLYNATLSNISASYQSGVWPYQFSAEALFYLHEYALGFKTGLASAYQTSQLASAIANADKEIKSSFIATSAPVQPELMQQLIGIESSIQELFALLIVLLVLVFATLVALLVLIAGNRKQSSRSKRGSARRSGMA
ncbi:MAG: S16 family serine protease [Candidatus Micrarchaeaceae archaeon]